jgi:glycosyltransferase involved in cell wall biosynthesis
LEGLILDEKLIKRVGISDEYPIRILHVVTQMNRNGLESRTMDLYRNIDRNKIQFDFFTHRKTQGQFDDEIRELGGKVYYNNELSPFRFIQYIKTLEKFFRENKYAIVHAHLNTSSTWILLAAKKAGVPIRIAHSRNSGMERNWKALFKILSRLFINIPTTHKFACSRQAGEWLFGKKGILPPEHFKVIPNAIDTSKLTYSEEKRKLVRNELGLTNELAIVNVGRLTYQKNHFFLLDIFRSIIEIKPNSKLFLIGEGELRADIERRIELLGLTNKVLLLGTQKDVGKYLQAMDVFIFPSHFEGFGTVVIESQCIGLPTLASDVLPKETKITDRLEFLSLQDNSTIWARKAVEMAQCDRKGKEKETKTAGYDIKSTYSDLQDFYLKCYEDEVKQQTDI